MSGGSLGYLYMKLEICKHALEDPVMEGLASDLVTVLHDCEWWRDGDIPEEDYRKAVKEFKSKWIKPGKTESLKRYVDSEISKVRQELIEMIGDKKNESHK